MVRIQWSMWFGLRFSHKGYAGADIDQIGDMFCSCHMFATNHNIIKEIKRLTRTQKQNLKAVLNRFLCIFVNEANF